MAGEKNATIMADALRKVRSIIIISLAVLLPVLTPKTNSSKIALI
jgi:hypothetical protein